MNRDPKLVEKRRKWIGLYMRKKQRQANYEYQAAIEEAASVFSIKKRTAIQYFTEYKKTHLVTSTHLQLELPL